MKKIIYAIFLITTCAYSQLGNRNSYNIKSPNVSDFIRYGNIPVKMYTGELDLNLPLVSIPVPNQEPINISLSYNASGFIPDKRSGIVGLNWNLNGIGAITREVKGIPDDYVGAPTTDNGINGRSAHGFMVGMKYLKNASAALPNGLAPDTKIISVRNNTGDQYFTPRFTGSAGNRTDSFETTPDIFNFNVNNLSGKFFMTSDGKIKVVSNDPNLVSVDLSNFNFQPIYGAECTPMTSEIKIIDSQGNKYYFGGESRYLEYTLNYNKTNQSIDPQSEVASNPVINTWFLKRIEYYNGEIVNYNYQDDKLTSASYFCSDRLNFFKGSNLSPDIKKFFFMTETANHVILQEGTSTTSGAGGSENIYTLHKKAFLDNITGTNFTLQFNYTAQGYVFNNNSNLNSYFKDFPEYKLDVLVLTNRMQEIKRINLVYSLKGGLNQANSYPRLFLDNIQEEGKPAHVFEYDIQPGQLLPKPSTCAVDFWGYYNGKLTNDAPPFGFNNLIAESTVDANGDFTYTSDIRNSNFYFAKIGILKKITYPTGGYSEFEYEPHLYGKRLERRSAGNFLPALYNVNGEVGGMRIKKITDFDGVANTNIKEYLYTNANNTSSGILMQWPRTKLTFSYSYSGSGSGGFLSWWSVRGSETKSIIQSSSINMNSIENSVINYSRVIEKNNLNGYVVNNFKDYVNYPDLNDFSNQVSTMTYSNITETFTPENMLKNIDLLYNDRSIERGKLESKFIYNNNDFLVQKEEYLYNSNANRFLLNSNFVAISQAWRYTPKQYFYSDFLTQKKTTLYNTTNSIVTTENFVYNSIPSYSLLMSNQDILSKKNSLTSINNELLETQYKYPSDIYTAGSTNYINFQTANIITPLSESQFRNGVKLSENFTVFAKDATTSNLLLPKFVYGGKFPNNYTNVTDVGTLEKKATYDLYDTKGNINQYTQENGAPITILWGYNKALPIAKIENATLAQVATALGVTTTVLQGYNEANLTTTVLNGLRTNLSAAMITSYIQIPLVGVSTITDPKGDVMTYTYDDSNRLLNVKDKNGNVLSQYTYHYKNQ